MIHLVTQYFSFSKILLLGIGLWPYQQSKFAQLHFIFFFVILTTATIFQFTTFVTLKFYTAGFIARILSTALAYTTFMIKYSSLRVNIKTVKDLLTQLQCVYNELTDENEIAIINKYGYDARRYTVTLTTFVACCMTTISIAQFWTEIFHVVLPTNESRPHNTHIVTEYFVNQQDYYFLILLHTYLGLFIGLIAMLAIGVMLITFLQHICGMFTISSYRIGRAVRTNMLKNNCLNSKNLISKRIVYAVDIHRHAMKLAGQMMSRFERWFFCLIIFGVASLSLNLFRIFQIASSENNIRDYLIPLIFVMVSIIYMFISNSIGQDIMDHNNHVFVTAYNIPWYSTPLYIQKTILFLLQRAVREFSLTVGGLFVASLECFATLVKASASYFTVMYSTQ